MRKDLQVAETKVLAEERYARYLYGAIFYNYFMETSVGMVGIMQGNAPDKIELPSQLDYLKNNITPSNTGIRALLSDINKQQTIKGRVGILADITDSGYKILQYTAENIVNWGTSYTNGEYQLDFVLLNETSMQREGFKYYEDERYRLCALDANGDYYSMIIEPDQLEELDILNPPEDVVYPVDKGQTSKKIPFVFINADNLDSDVSDAPLLDIANLCLHIYNASADYRQFLFGTSQDTLFLKGFEADELDVIRIGTGSLIASTNDSADAKFIGISSSGLSENRVSLENLHVQAKTRGVSLLDNGVESGEALGIRTQIKTAPLRTISQTAARGVETLIKIIAEWAGLNPDEVIIEANSDFTSSKRTVDEITKLWNSRVPISEETIHSELVKNGVTDKTYEEESKEGLLNEQTTTNDADVK